MPFKLAKQGELSPPTLYPSPDIAVTQGKSLWEGEDFEVQEVRDATLGDFLNVQNIIGDMREIMQTKCGRTDVLDDPEFIGNADLLGYYIQQALEFFQEQTGIKLDGCLIVEKTLYVKSEQ